MTAVALISIPRNAVKAAGTGAWFAIIIVTVLFIFGIFIIASLSKMFEGKTIYEYSNLLVGRFMTKIIGFIYTTYFCFFSILLFRIISDFIKANSLPLTPIWAILLMFIGVILYIVYKGITTIGRLLEIYGFIFIVVSLATHTAEFFLGDANYIKPFFEPKLVKEYIFGAKDLISAFIGIEILTIIPFGKVNNKRGVLYSVLGVLYVGLFYIFATETSVMIVGINDILYYNASLVEAIRETKLPSVFFLERSDILFLTVGTIGILSGLATILFAATENIVKLFSITKRNIVIVAVGILVFISCMFLNESRQVIYLFENVLPIIGILTGFIIPIILFIIAKVKKYES